MNFKHLIFLSVLNFSVIANADIKLDKYIQNVESFNKTPASERCATVTQEEKMGPVHNQGDVLWCFGYAAADLLTYEFNLGPKDQISPLWISSNHHLTTEEDNRKFLKERKLRNFKENDNSAYLMLNKFIEIKNDERDEDGRFKNPYVVPPVEQESMGQYSSMASKEKTKLSETGGGFTHNAVENALSKSKLCTVKDLKKLEDLAPMASSLVIEMNGKKKCDTLEKKSMGQLDAQEVLKATKSYMNDFIHKQCQYKKSKSMDKLKVENRYYGSVNPISEDSQKEALFEINDLLNKNKILTLNYRAQLISHLSEEHKKHDYHASSIIGRKLVGDKCYYQIRNSWGKSCSYYKSTPEVICEHGGSIYVEEKSLLNQLNGITFVK